MLEALGQSALRALLLTATIQLALWLFPIRRAQLQLMVWTCVLAASLAMPVLQWATPFRFKSIPDLPRVTLEVQSIALVGETADEWQPSLPQQAQAASVPNLGRQVTIKPWLEALYVLMSGIMLLRLGVGVTLAFRLLGKAAPVHLKWAGDAQVRISSHVLAPVTIFRVILLPVDFAEWPLVKLQAILAHERSHVARWDFTRLLLSQINRAIFWFSPLSWWLHRRIATLAELASDDDAIDVMGDRAGYAEILLEMGQRSGPMLQGLAMARPATLSYRIERILSETARLNPVTWVQGMPLTLGIAVLSIAAASQDHNSGSTQALTTLSKMHMRPISLTNPSSSLPRAAGDLFEPAPWPSTQTDVRSHLAPQRADSRQPAVAQAKLQSSPAIRIPAREIRSPVISHRVSVPPGSAWQPSRTTAEDYALRSSRQTEAPHSAGSAPEAFVRQNPTNSSIGLAFPHQGASLSPDSEPPMVKLIDQQTCTGAFLLGPLQPPYASKIGYLNVIRAKFFRKADGTTWLTFSSGGDFPVSLPVTVTGRRVEFIGMVDTVFTMSPVGANHLTGTTSGPTGTVDLTCGGPNVHLFDGKS